MEIKTKTQEEVEEEMNLRNAEITEEILSGKARLIDLSDYETEDYIKCSGAYLEKIGGRWRVAFARCPKCRQHISVYQDEMRDNEGHTKLKKCVCGFQKTLLLKKWAKR